MPEDVVNLGALDASSTTNFDLRNARVFPLAAFLSVKRLEIPNNSAAHLTITANGRSYPVARGAAAVIVPGGEIESFSVTTDANAVSAGEVRAIAKGPVHPSIAGVSA